MLDKIALNLKLGSAGFLCRTRQGEQLLPWEWDASQLQQYPLALHSGLHNNLHVTIYTPGWRGAL